MMNSPKTIFCDIDGTLLKHQGDIIRNTRVTEALPNVTQTIRQWDKNNYKIILTTGRKESTREQTVEQLKTAGIVYDQLIMGIPNGPRILINDKKERGVENTAYAINLIRNEGLENLDLTSKCVTVPDSHIFLHKDTSWGYEKLIECNDKYAMKKIHMQKGTNISIQCHQLKRFTLVVLSGELDISIGSSSMTLELRRYIAGDSITIKPQAYYTMSVVEDCLYLETSTNEIWESLKA